ncbi:MAG: hypothetical protein EBR15_04605, partial [Gammaproteobacteria bacterium]|nr:hypothetical protein [Gammaproteobacteria bacterium]
EPSRLEAVVDELELQLQARSGREVASIELGEMVLQQLAQMSDVAYVRFASVYRSFQDVEAFRDEVEKLRHRRRREPLAGQMSLLGDPPVGQVGPPRGRGKRDE